ncbi:hypothetical protein [Commensalibacter oyaizuii]|uniref:Uncharacterized protein n=1 Tax=Commensalibacter oyaizuii TaxID=3043873 RepID=A0ABT6Q453_9PROT|nr:hypothetical protein [Commensalibacter sp. TBRC 16381]MDI2091289.1 hypothetical protein [Commensalibacter sp. TBRC 16381]
MQNTIVDFSATAGHDLNIVVCGDNVNDAHNGDLTVTAGDLSGQIRGFTRKRCHITTRIGQDAFCQ